MSVTRRVVFDTSTLIGAMLQIDSVPHRAFTQALARTQVCASVATVDELERVLTRRKFDRYQPAGIRLQFLSLVRAHAHLFDVQAADVAAVNPPCRDPTDNKFLALAQVCAAQALVSSDADLLVVHPWHEIAIMTPAAFSASVAAP